MRLPANYLFPRSEQIMSSYAQGKLFASWEQIMSAVKYPSIFSRQMEAIVYIILQIFFATRAVVKIGEYYSQLGRYPPLTIDIEVNSCFSM